MLCALHFSLTPGLTQATEVRAIYYAKGEDIYRSDADGGGEMLVIHGGGWVRQIRIDQFESDLLVRERGQ